MNERQSPCIIFRKTQWCDSTTDFYSTFILPHVHLSGLCEVSVRFIIPSWYVITQSANARIPTLFRLSLDFLLNSFFLIPGLLGHTPTLFIAAVWLEWGLFPGEWVLPRADGSEGPLCAGVSVQSPFPPTESHSPVDLRCIHLSEKRLVWVIVNSGSKDTEWASGGRFPHQNQSRVSSSVGLWLLASMLLPGGQLAACRQCLLSLPLLTFSLCCSVISP